MSLHSIAALLAVLTITTTTTASAQQTLRLAVGSQKRLSLPAIQRVAVGDPSIADVKTLGEHELVVIGVSAGRTTLLVWSSGAPSPERFEVTVTGSGGNAAAPTPSDAPPPPPPRFTPTLKVGEKRTRSTPQLLRMAVGEPSIAGVTTDEGVTTLVGGSPGKTTVLLWFADGHREEWLVTVVK